MQQAREYIGGREFPERGDETNTLSIEIRTRTLRERK